jgi:hypothetical protein
MVSVMRATIAHMIIILGIWMESSWTRIMTVSVIPAINVPALMTESRTGMAMAWVMRATIARIRRILTSGTAMGMGSATPATTAGS